MMSTYSWLIAISVPLSSWLKKHTMNNATDAIAIADKLGLHFFDAVQKLKEKDKKLSKCLDECYASVVGNIAIDLAKKYCRGCKFGFMGGALFHACMLPDDFKIKKYGKPALYIARINGLLNFSFKKKMEEKNIK